MQKNKTLRRKRINNTTGYTKKRKMQKKTYALQQKRNKDQSVTTKTNKQYHGLHQRTKNAKKTKALRQKRNKQ